MHHHRLLLPLLLCATACTIDVQGRRSSPAQIGADLGGDFEQASDNQSAPPESDVFAASPMDTADTPISLPPEPVDICEAPRPDSDGDGTVDCFDECPSDPDKTLAGRCGCGVPEQECMQTPPAPPCNGEDGDLDGVDDCMDGCPTDPSKQAAGQCGCGVAETDSDGDSIPDCIDACAADSDKQDPGLCGCGRSENDSDGDGQPDCNDQCPMDPGKTWPQECGCGVADTDSDGDGRPDCNDECPDDPNKLAPGECGCGQTDDRDGDGWLDCVESCPFDKQKTLPGECGCGIADSDVNGDGDMDCEVVCHDDGQQEICECPDSDFDCDNIPPRLALVFPNWAPVKRKDFAVEVEARDPDGYIDYVSLYVDGEWVGDDWKKPFHWDGHGKGKGKKRDKKLGDLDPGPHRLDVVAADSEGATTTLSMDFTVVR